MRKEYGIKTIFYDSTGLLPEDPIAKNIPLVSNKDSIRNFIKKNF